MIKIVTAPSEALSQKAKPVKKIDKKIIDEMKQALLLAKDPEGVGLAAPQLGKLLSIFVIKPTLKSPIKVFINPRIVSSIEYKVLSKKGNFMPNTKYKIHNTRLEGCLSLPNIWGEVRRKPSLTLEYIDEKGKNHTQTFKGFFATIIQHEIDHLNGVLFTKRALEQNGQLYKSYKDEKGEDIFEELEI